jgi:hypothetical protein
MSSGRRAGAQITGARIAIAYAALRIAYALGLLGAPARVARPWLGADAGRPASEVALRGLGMRDLALATGVLSAAASGAPARWWLAGCAAGDAADLVATLSADGERLPRRAKPGTVAAAGGFGAIAMALAVWEAR